MARSNLFIKVGTYTGNNTDNTNITGLGFRPDFVLVKGAAQISIFRTKTMTGDSAGYMAGGTANGANLIQEILNDGFQVGTGATVNANATTYHYLAIKGLDSQKYFYAGKYIGDAVDNRNFTTGGFNFTPDIVFTKGDTAQQSAFRIASFVGDYSSSTSVSTGAQTNCIQNLQANGFQLGTNARVNGSGLAYHFLAFKHLTGVISSGKFTGDGTDDRAITGLGFQPDFVLVKNETTTDAAIIRTSSFVGDSSVSLAGVDLATNQIQSFDTDGFTIGSADSVNKSGSLISWIAIKAGSYNIPIARTTV